MSELKELFKEITLFNPYDFQIQCMEALSKGKSIIVSAPTGSGKSEAILVPFIEFANNILPTQLIYCLPTRTLVESIADRARTYAKLKSMRTVAHHGKHAESSLFEEDIIVTTIDQAVGAYVSTPLSMPLKFGNIHAGAVSSAFLAFDEIHTFDPERGLQTALALLEQSSTLRLPIVVMSATLPEVAINRMERVIKSQGMKAEKIIVEDENEIQSRKHREVTVTPQIKKQLDGNEVIKAINSSNDGKVIVICNTVEKAQKLFRELKNRENLKVLLLHSRFLDDDRERIESELRKYFGKGSEKNYQKDGIVFISTQVIEVGMDISAYTLLSEISPIDSLIQRVGRCARWGGKGEVYLYDVENYEPYESKLIKKTKKVIGKTSILLDWVTERRLINAVLEAHFKKFLNPSYMHEIFGILARAAYEGGKNIVEEAIREIYTCEVSIHDDPEILKDDVWRLPKIRVDSRVLRSKFNKLNLKLWMIEEDPTSSDDKSKFYSKLVTNKNEIMPFRFYVVHPEAVSYNSNEGLIFGESGSAQKPIAETLGDKLKKPKERQKEYWVYHSKNTLRVFDDIFASRYNFIINRFAEIFSLKKADLLYLMRLAIAFHDVGKLNIKWQKAAGWKEGEPPLAHCSLNIQHLPPHATVSAAIMQKCLCHAKDLWKSLILAIAHHHAPRVRQHPSYKLIRGYENVLKDVGLNFEIRNITPEGRGGVVPFTFIEIRGTQNKYYRFYSFLSKVLRLSDWIASGDGNYESLFYC